MYIYINYIYTYILYIIYIVQDEAARPFQWFSENQVKRTQIYVNKDKSSEIHISEFIIKSSDCEKLLDIKID